MAKIYIITREFSSYDKDGKRQGTLAHNLNAYQDERKALEELRAKAESYKWRLEENRFNFITMRHNSADVNIQEEDGSSIYYKYRIETIELQ